MAPTSGAVPSSMDKAEGLTEDVQDDITAAHWSAAQAKVSQLQTLKGPLGATGTSQQNLTAYAGALDSLSTAIRQHRKFPALTAANHISRALNAMMSNYSTKVPIPVAYVAGRDALYDAQQGLWNAAGDAVSEIRRDYAMVASHVKSTNPSLDRTITSELDQMQQATAAKNTARMTSLANSFLDNVDNVEKTYGG